METTEQIVAIHGAPQPCSFELFVELFAFVNLAFALLALAFAIFFALALALAPPGPCPFLPLPPLPLPLSSLAAFSVLTDPVLAAVGGDSLFTDEADHALLGDLDGSLFVAW